VGSKLRLLIMFLLPLISRYRDKKNRTEFFSLLVIGMFVILSNWPAETLWIRKALLDFITLISGG
jgi:hypothetical protein